MDDRRKTQRRRTYLGGLIASDQHDSTTECIVRDLSGSGALIALPSTADLPAVFDFLIPKKGETYPARTVWLTKTRAGIAFSKRPTNVISFEEAQQRKTEEEDRRRLAKRIEDWVL